MVLDTETTGTGDRAEVIDLAIISAYDGRLLFDSPIMPQGRIPGDASAVHGLTRPALRRMGARTWPEIHPTIVEALRGVTTALAWNAPYDRRLLRQTAKRHGLRLPGLDWSCIMEIEAATRGPYARFAKLADAARRYGVPATGAHRAAADARMALAVARAMVARR